MSRPPNLFLYCFEADLPLLYELLGDDLAFVVPDGERRWRATADRPRQKHFRLDLWHVDGGPIQVVSGDRKVPMVEVEDPWSGWHQRCHPDHGPPLPLTVRRTSDWRDDPEPFGFATEGRHFMATQNLFSLSVRVPGKEAGSSCGISSLSWIGNRYASIGSPAPDVTVRRWNRLKRDIGKCAVKVPAGGPAGTGKPEFWAFPHALAQGGPFDRFSWR